MLTMVLFLKLCRLPNNRSSGGWSFHPIRTIFGFDGPCCPPLSSDPAVQQSCPQARDFHGGSVYMQGPPPSATDDCNNKSWRTPPLRIREAPLFSSSIRRGNSVPLPYAVVRRCRGMLCPFSSSPACTTIAPLPASLHDFPYRGCKTKKSVLQ